MKTFEVFGVKVKTVLFNTGIKIFDPVSLNLADKIARYCIEEKIIDKSFCRVFLKYPPEVLKESQR